MEEGTEAVENAGKMVVALENIPLEVAAYHEVALKAAAVAVWEREDD